MKVEKFTLVCNTETETQEFIAREFELRNNEEVRVKRKFVLLQRIDSLLGTLRVNFTKSERLLLSYSRHPLIRTPKGLRVLFELTNVRIIGNCFLACVKRWSITRPTWFALD